MEQTVFSITPIRVVNTGINYGTEWFDVDLSNYIPVGATGAVVCIWNSDAGSKYWGIRKNGSTDNRYDDISGFTYCWGIVGVDADRKIEFKNYYSLDNNRPQLWLVGYTMAGVTMLTNGTLISSVVGVGAWESVDLSATLPIGTSGVILEVYASISGTFAWGTRKNGSSDNRIGTLGNQKNVFCAIVGVDAGKIVQLYKGHANVLFYLVGYVTDGIVFYTDAKDFTPPVLSKWTYLTSPTTATQVWTNNAASTFHLTAYAVGETRGMSFIDVYNFNQSKFKGPGESEIGSVSTANISSHAFAILSSYGLRGGSYQTSRRKL